MNQSSTHRPPTTSCPLELGYNSVDPVRAMLGTDWSDIEVRPDLAGFPRVMAARLSG